MCFLALHATFDEKTLFPKYILDYDAKVKVAQEKELQFQAANQVNSIMNSTKQSDEGF